MFPSAGSPAGSKQLFQYTFNQTLTSTLNNTFTAGTTITLFTVSGKGVLGEVSFNFGAIDMQAVVPTISIDGGPDIPLQQGNGSSAASGVYFTGTGLQAASSTTLSTSPVTIVPIYVQFKTSFVLKVRNTGASAPTTGSCLSRATYYT